MNLIPYVYVRSLEFEGRHPHDAGQWGVTDMRLRYLEGLPNFDDHMVSSNPDGTFQNTPFPLRTSFFWPNRTRFYRRIRSAKEAAHVIALRGPDALTKVCVPLFSNWVNPRNGIISMPTPGEPAAPDTHAVHLISPHHGTSVGEIQDAHHHFLFANSWGEEWGHQGYGMLPFAYYDRYAFEQWTTYILDEFSQIQVRKPSPGWIAWQGRDEFDRRVYAFEVGDPDQERLGWAFAIETEGAIEVEELFVAPEARGRGIGSRLADQVSQLSKAKGMPLRVWVPFADAKRESPATAAALPKIAERLGVQFHPSPVPWAAYFATSDQPGSPVPTEPEVFPSRPKSTRDAMNAFFAGIGLAVGQAAPLTSEKPSGQQSIVTPHPSLTLDSPEWKAMNSRRSVLIRKKNREGLDESERAEFEQLQAAARALVEGASQRPHLYAPEIEAVLAAKAAK